jgi:hypothetical protein
MQRAAEAEQDVAGRRQRLHCFLRALVCRVIVQVWNHDPRWGDHARAEDGSDDAKAAWQFIGTAAAKRKRFVYGAYAPVD